MDLSIAIRTATIYNEKIFFSAGGGIVFDSDSYDEYDETLHKGRTLMEIFQGKEKRDCQQNYVWANGNIQVADQASIPISDLGFQYGYGFFETIRVNQNHPQYLDEHITRFYRTWQYLFFDDPPDLSWDEIIGRVIDKNDLIDKTAVVKIMASMGDREAPPFNHNLLVTARPYIHRLAEKREPGLNLATYPESRQTPLADHKTFNYLYYYLAGKWVQSQGADEALIINPDGTVSETNTANILLIKDKTVIKPVSNHVLPGIMQNVVCKLLAGWGLGIVDKEVRPKDLFKSDQIMITNSLIGVVPALRLDGEKLPNPSGLWQKVNDVVLNSA
jgi:para-aminobenzoate synthetase component 1